MKFVLILVAAILMVLGIYTYSNQTTEKSTPVPKPKISEKKIETQETEEVSVVTQEVKEEKSSAKNIAVESPKVVSQEMGREMKEILPSVHNSTVMNDKLATDEEYTPNINQTSDEPLTDKEWDNIEKQMIESGQISQEGDSSESTENLGYDPSELAG